MIFAQDAAAPVNVQTSWMAGFVVFFGATIVLLMFVALVVFLFSRLRESNGGAGIFAAVMCCLLTFGGLFLFVMFFSVSRVEYVGQDGEVANQGAMPVERSIRARSSSPQGVAAPPRYSEMAEEESEWALENEPLPLGEAIVEDVETAMEAAEAAGYLGSVAGTYPAPPPVAISPRAPLALETVGPSASASDGSITVLPRGVTVATMKVNHATWDSLDPKQFGASHYPELKATVLPLAHKIHDLVDRGGLRDKDGPVEPCDSISVYGLENEPGGNQIRVLFAEKMRELFPDHQVGIFVEPPAAPQECAVELWVHLSVKRRSLMQSSYDPGEAEEGGVLQAVLSVPESSVKDQTVQCVYVEKPWVESFDEFVSRYPSENWLVGYTPSFANSEYEARERAFDDVVKQSTLIVNGLAVSYVREDFVVDRFTQKLTRSYGDVWREAVLVRVPQQARAVAVGQVTRESRRAGNALRARLVGIVSLVMVVLILAGALNWITKAYYRTPIVCMVLIVGSLIAVMSMG